MVEVADLVRDPIGGVRGDEILVAEIEYSSAVPEQGVLTTRVRSDIHWPELAVLEPHPGDVHSARAAGGPGEGLGSRSGRLDGCFVNHIREITPV